MDSVISFRERLQVKQIELFRCYGDLISHMFQQRAANEQGHVFDPVIQYDMAAVRTAWMDMQELHFQLDQLFRPIQSAQR